MDLGGARLVDDEVDDDDEGVMMGMTGGASRAMDVAVVVTAAAFDPFNDFAMDTSRPVDEMDTKTHVTTTSKTNGLEKSRQF